MTKADSGNSDAIADYLNKLWNTLSEGSDLSSVSSEEAEKAAMRLRRKGRSQKLLRNRDIPNLSDEDLESAAMDWIRSSVKNWANPYEEIMRLPIPCQTVYSCRAVADEVLNGGLIQLFYNSMQPLAEMSIAGFAALGAPKLSHVMEKALEVYHKNKHTFDRYGDGTPDGFSALSDDHLFNDLDEAFIMEYTNVSIAAYIRKNAEFFGGNASQNK